MKKSFGAWLGVALLGTGMTQSELAEAVDIETPRISEYKTGKKIPSYELAVKIAVSLGVVDLSKMEASLRESVWEKYKGRKVGFT